MLIRVARAPAAGRHGGFADLQVRSETVIGGEIADQAALHGLLERLRRLDIAVIDVQVAP